jgi:hypothetical protein
MAIIYSYVDGEKYVSGSPEHEAAQDALKAKRIAEWEANNPGRNYEDRQPTFHTLNPDVNPWYGDNGVLTVDAEGNRGTKNTIYDTDLYPGGTPLPPDVADEFNPYGPDNPAPPFVGPELPPSMPPPGNPPPGNPPPGGPWVPPPGGKGNLPPMGGKGGGGGQPSQPPANPYPMYGYNRPYGAGGIPMQYTLQGPQGVQEAPMPQQPSPTQPGKGGSYPVQPFNQTSAYGGKGGGSYAEGGRVGYAGGGPMDWSRGSNSPTYGPFAGRHG